MSGSLVAVPLGLLVAEVATSEATIQHLIFVGFFAVAVLIAAWSIVTARARPRRPGLVAFASVAVAGDRRDRGHRPAPRRTRVREHPPRRRRNRQGLLRRRDE